MSASMKNITDLNDQYVILSVHNNLFGLPVSTVQDVIYTPKMTRVPRAAGDVVGLLNLRGRIVTAIDLGIKLGMEPVQNTPRNMSVILDVDGEFYSLVVHDVGEVRELDEPALYEKNPNALDVRWRPYSSGIYQMDKQLVILLDENKIFSDVKRKPL